MTPRDLFIQLQTLDPREPGSWPTWVHIVTAVLLTIVLTFFGAAACYRTSTHMSVMVFVRMMPGRWKRGAEYLGEALVAALAIFMVVYGLVWWRLFHMMLRRRRSGLQMRLPVSTRTTAQPSKSAPRSAAGPAASWFPFRW